MSQRKSYKELQLTQLRSFCLAAVRGNFTAAAESLGLSVSAIWQQVRTLEQHLGVTLLRRCGRAVELTPEGRLFLELVQPHLSNFDSLTQVFEARRLELPRQLTVAATDYILCYNLPKAVEEFAASHPTVRLNLFYAESPKAVARRVEEGQAELGVAAYHPDEPRSSILDYQDLFELKFKLLCSRRHPLARKKHLVPADLADYPMILPPRGGYSQQALERLLLRHGLTDKVNILMESRSVSVVCHYVAQGLGIALYYIGSEICRFIPDLHERIFDPAMGTLPVAVMMRKGTHLTPHAADFRETICRLFTPHPTAKNSLSG